MKPSLHNDRELAMLVPPALLGDVSCYVLSDEHPCDQRPFDVVLCTAKGEVVELSRRQVTTSTCIDDGLVPREILIYRTSENCRFYLVSTFENIFVVSAKANLIIYKRFNNVDRFAVSDPYCNGSARLQIWCNDDAVPMVVDDNFENSLDNEDIMQHCHDGSTFVSSLKSKLIEAKHTVAMNNMRHDQLLKFRQDAMHTILQDVCPNPMDSTFKSCQKVHEALYVENITPWLKLCNGHVVLGVNVCNKTLSTTFSDIKFILQSNTDSPSCYHTYIYTTTNSAPFWGKRDDTSLGPKCGAAIVIVTDVEEFKQDNKIHYSGVVIYKMNGTEKFVPLRPITLSCLETLTESFDLLSSCHFDQTSFLAILPTVSSLRLKLHHIPATSEDSHVDWMSALQSDMKMDRVGATDNVLIHRKSPYHILNGVMIILENSDEDLRSVVATIYLREQSQLAPLLHLFYDAVRHKILITTPDVTVIDRRNPRVITTKTNLTHTSMEVDASLLSPREREGQDLFEFRNSLSTQMRLVLEYFDECMSSKTASRTKDHMFGTKIDLIAPGRCRYEEFTHKLNAEIKRGFSFL